MAFDNIRWQQVAPPDLGGVSRANWTTANLLSNATGSLDKALGNFREAQEDRATANILGALQQYGSAEEAQAALADGSALAGITPAHISARGRQLASGQIGDLSNLDTQKLGREATRHGMTMDERRFALDRQKAALANKMYADGAAARARKEQQDIWAHQLAEDKFNDYTLERNIQNEYKNVRNQNLSQDQILDSVDKLSTAYGMMDPTTQGYMRALSEENRALYNKDAGKINILDSELAKYNESIDTQQQQAKEANIAVANNALVASNRLNYERMNNVAMTYDKFVNDGAIPNNPEAKIINIRAREEIAAQLEQYPQEIKDKILPKLRAGEASYYDIHRVLRKSNSDEIDPEFLGAARSEISKNNNAVTKVINNVDDFGSSNLSELTESLNQIQDSNKQNQTQLNNALSTDVFSDEEFNKQDWTDDETVRKYTGLSLGKFNDMYRGVTAQNKDITRPMFARILQNNASANNNAFTKWWYGADNSFDEAQIEKDVISLGDITANQATYRQFISNNETLDAYRDEISKLAISLRLIETNRAMSPADKASAKRTLMQRYNIIADEINKIGKNADSYTGKK